MIARVALLAGLLLSAGPPRPAMGGRLPGIMPDSVLVPWDGVFFVLGRQ